MKTDKKKKLSSELIEPSIDLAIDYSELALDTIFDEGVLEEIPIIKTIVSTYKIGNSIKERHFAKKIALFLQEFYSNEIDENRLTKFRENFAQDEKYRNKVMEQISIYNDRFIDNQKSKILANLFASYIEDKMDWNYYLELAHCLNSLSPRTILLLHTISEMDFRIPFDSELAEQSVLGILTSSGILSTVGDNDYNFKATMGHDLYVYGKMSKSNNE